MDQSPRPGAAERGPRHPPDPARAYSRSSALLPVVAVLVSVAPLLFDAAQRSGPSPGWSASLAWLGCGLLGASLLLMVREPAVARAFGGLERMYRWHHVLGTVAYALLLAHPLALAVQRLPLGADAAWRALDPVGAGVSGWLGWLSLLGLMAGLAATFAMRLPYSLWRATHLTLAAAVLAGVAHTATLRGAAWPVLVFAATVAAAVAWRWLRADRGGAARPYEVIAAAHPARSVTEVTLKPLADPVDASPGQFVMAAFFAGPRFDGCGEYHPFSVSARDDGGVLRLAIKALGDCTGHIQHVAPGTAVRVQGPFGGFLAGESLGDELWLAAGIGIVPFLARLRTGPLADVTLLIHLVRDSGEAPFVEELSVLATRQPLLELRILAGADALERALALLDTVRGLPDRQAWLCGPPPVVGRFAQALRAHGVPPDRIHAERFDFR